tara:strand:- start:926 stop:1126 length:201 start_codon:yes stop_codon:yes gene_type:complete
MEKWEKKEVDLEFKVLKETNAENIKRVEDFIEEYKEIIHKLSYVDIYKPLEKDLRALLEKHFPYMA